MNYVLENKTKTENDGSMWLKTVSEGEIKEMRLEGYLKKKIRKRFIGHCKNLNFTMHELEAIRHL